MKRHSLDLVVVVVLFCVYATCAMFLCVIGAEVYRNTADTMQRNYDGRTSALYIAEKVRQNDLDGTVRLDSVENTNALVLIEKQSGRDYETWLFVQDRMLYEGVFAPGSVPDVKLCQPIMPMESMSVSMDESNGSLLNVTFNTVDGQSPSIDIWLRSQRLAGV